MDPMSIHEQLRRDLLDRQRDEITEYYIYNALADMLDDPKNAELLREIAEAEMRHYQEWRMYTGQEVPPSRFKIWLYLLLARIFGLVFTLRLMERGERRAQAAYERILRYIPQAETILREEEEHEERLLGLLQEERLAYISSIVLGLNDALVELMGALAGLTLALQNGPLIALSGMITGTAAALSMAASEYLSTKAEGGEKHPVRAATYTGITYFGAVIALILPYLFLDNYYLSLATSLLIAVLLIAAFTFYTAVVKETSFWRNFLEMTLITFGVAAFSFALGYALRLIFGVDIDV
ncbi:MAG: rubrerythrin family protein [Chloroflexi bacterium]|nr:rubrerythrin family protein [Chloroflexota bacterium]